MWIITSLFWCLAATEDTKLLCFDVVASHVATRAHRYPEAAIISGLDGMWSVRSTWKLDRCLFAGLRVQRDHASLADVDSVHVSIRADFQVVE